MRTTRSQAARIVPPQGELIGQGLVRSGVLSSANVEQILVIQRRDDERQPFFPAPGPGPLPPRPLPAAK